MKTSSDGSAFPASALGALLLLTAPTGRGQALAAAGTNPGTGRATPAEDQSVRPFKVNIPAADKVDLRRRLAVTRWPDRETVSNASQGAQQTELQGLVRYCGRKQPPPVGRVGIPVPDSLPTSGRRAVERTHAGRQEALLHRFR